MAKRSRTKRLYIRVVRRYWNMKFQVNREAFILASFIATSATAYLLYFFSGMFGILLSWWNLFVHGELHGGGLDTKFWWAVLYRFIKVSFVIHFFWWVITTLKHIYLWLKKPKQKKAF